MKGNGNFVLDCCLHVPSLNPGEPCFRALCPKQVKDDGFEHLTTFLGRAADAHCDDCGAVQAVVQTCPPVHLFSSSDVDNPLKGYLNGTTCCSFFHSLTPVDLLKQVQKDAKRFLNIRQDTDTKYRVAVWLKNGVIKVMDMTVLPPVANKACCRVADDI